MRFRIATQPARTTARDPPAAGRSDSGACSWSSADGSCVRGGSGRRDRRRRTSPCERTPTPRSQARAPWQVRHQVRDAGVGCVTAAARTRGGSRSLPCRARSRAPRLWLNVTSPSAHGGVHGHRGGLVDRPVSWKRRPALTGTALDQQPLRRPGLGPIRRDPQPSRPPDPGELSAGQPRRTTGLRVDHPLRAGRLRGCGSSTAAADKAVPSPATGPDAGRIRRPADPQGAAAQRPARQSRGRPSRRLRRPCGRSPDPNRWVGLRPVAGSLGGLAAHPLRQPASAWTGRAPPHPRDALRRLRDS